jgi:hypothetical protein
VFRDPCFDLRARVDLFAVSLEEAKVGADRIPRRGDRLIAGPARGDAAEQVKDMDERRLLLRSGQPGASIARAYWPP